MRGSRHWRRQPSHYLTKIVQIGWGNSHLGQAITRGRHKRCSFIRKRHGRKRQPLDDPHGSASADEVRSDQAAAVVGSVGWGCGMRDTCRNRAQQRARAGDSVTVTTPAGNTMGELHAPGATLTLPCTPVMVKSNAPTTGRAGSDTLQMTRSCAEALVWLAQMRTKRTRTARHELV